jgi:putative DNA primase/helicase
VKDVSERYFENIDRKAAVPPDEPFDELAASLPDDRTGDNFGPWLEKLAAAGDEEDLFERLSGQRAPRSRLVQQMVRGRLKKILAEKFEEFSSEASAAKIADAWLQEGSEPSAVQGQEFRAEEVEPWRDAVAGAVVLEEVVDLFRAYVYATADQLVVLALWVAYSHIFDLFGVSPLLDLTSPVKRCGKTTACIVLRHLCRKPLLSGNLTPAALFRAVDAWQPTLLIDEADSFAKLSEELRGILNAGHTRDTAFTIRAEGDQNEPRLFSTWAPKVVAAIGHLPDTIEDRAIRVALVRKPTMIEKRDAFDTEAVRADCGPVRQRVARFVLDNLDAIGEAIVIRPEGLNDRAWNNARPLLAVAAAAGPRWLERGTSAVLALAGDDDGDDDVKTLALRHVWEAVEPVGRMSTADVLSALVARDDGSPWAKWWEAKLARKELKSPAAHLAKLLRSFGIRPKQLWIDEQKERGYDAEDFRAATVASYLERDGSPGRHGRPASNSGAGSTVPTAPTDFSGVPERNTLIAIGDPMYPALLAAAANDRHITKEEFEHRLELHKLVELGPPF